MQQQMTLQIMSPNQGQGSYYLSPLQSCSCIGTQETRDTCGEPVKAVSR